MSRRSNIRWQKSDSEELNRAVKNFNAKISRLEKKNPELKNALPEKVSARQLKELINTRQDLKREINSLRRFSKKGSEEIETYGDYNIKVTKWQRKEMNRRVGIINRKRQQRLEELEELEMQSGGESLGYTKGQLGMGRIERVELAPMKALTKGMNQRDVNMKWRNILKESQSEFLQEKDYRCRENYIKGLEENFNPSDVEDIIAEIEDMDIKDFIKTFYSDQDASFEGIYAPNNEQYEGYLSQLKSVWL